MKILKDPQSGNLGAPQAAMGGNLNQLARMANTAGQVRPEVPAAAEAAQRAADRLAAAAAAVEALTRLRSAG